MSSNRLIDVRNINTAIAIFDPAIELHLLQHGAELITALALATLCTIVSEHILSEPSFGAGTVGVLDVEDGFARLDKGGKLCALAVLNALLVDGEVDDGEHGGDDVACVLEAEREVERGGDVGEVLDEGDGVLGCEGETVVVLLFFS
jgi:hypothetical protein